MQAFAKSLNVGAMDCSVAMEAWDQICTSLERHRRLFLFADFDGTLSELVDIPSDATIDSNAKSALRRLYKEPGVTTVILSGRSVNDVAERVGLPVIYGGDHGLEIHAPDFQFIVPEVESIRLRLPELSNKIRRAVAHIPGALVETKRLTSSVHYRQVEARHVEVLRLMIEDCVAGTEFQLKTGNCVFEIRPAVNWGKGHAVRWLLDRFGAVPQQAICIGDDETDEDMFRSAPDAVNVKVVREDDIGGSARCYVTQADVAKFLHGVADVAEGVCSNQQYVA